MSVRSDLRKAAYQNAQRAAVACREAEDDMDLASPADAPAAIARAMRARRHMHSAAMRYRNMRPRQENSM